MPQSEKSNLHEDLPFGSYPPRPSVNKMTSKFYTEEHDICDGEVKLLRTKLKIKIETSVATKGPNPLAIGYTFVKSPI